MKNGKTLWTAGLAVLVAAAAKFSGGIPHTVLFRVASPTESADLFRFGYIIEFRCPDPR
ncbi:MAG: hypothetical protein IJL26_10105 [Clostridia bacterium]|nr:hypothetical protein [Clostridia bacterium]